MKPPERVVGVHEAVDPVAEEISDEQHHEKLHPHGIVMRPELVNVPALIVGKIEYDDSDQEGNKFWYENLDDS